MVSGGAWAAIEKFLVQKGNGMAAKELNMVSAIEGYYEMVWV